MRKGNIDLLKFIFACVLVIYHFNAYAGVGLFQCGYNVVSFFFIVSGYFMTVAAVEKPQVNPLGTDTFEMIKKKIAHIAPEFYISWIIAFVVLHISNFSFKTCIKDLSESLFDLMFLRMAGLKTYSPNTVTWYISAMFLAFLIIWPIARKWTDMYLKVISPVAFVLMLGAFCQRYESISSWKDWMGIMYSGLFRAFFSILAGSVCYSVSKYIKGLNNYRGVATVASIGSFVGILILLLFGQPGVLDFGLFVLFMILVSVSTSGMSYLSEKLNNKVSYWLGEASISIYLGHNFWKFYFLRDNAELLNGDYVRVLVVYIIAVMITALSIMYLSRGLRRICQKKT